MMARTIGQQLNTKVNVPPKDMVQFVSAYGAAILGQWRLERLASAPEQCDLRSGSAYGR
jgi:activator of 2-hydroxyglutaryl-CoA dehydratase